MHELTVATNLLDRAVETAAEHDADAVTGIAVAVGRATHLNPDQVRFCVETVAEGTPAEGAAVSVEQVDPHGRCDCGWEGEPETVVEAVTYVPDPTCPACGGRVELTRGRGCHLVSIDVPGPDDPAAESAEQPRDLSNDPRDP